MILDKKFLKKQNYLLKIKPKIVQQISSKNYLGNKIVFLSQKINSFTEITLPIKLFINFIKF